MFPFLSTWTDVIIHAFCFLSRVKVQGEQAQCIDGTPNAESGVCIHHALFQQIRGNMPLVCGNQTVLIILSISLHSVGVGFRLSGPAPCATGVDVDMI